MVSAPDGSLFLHTGTAGLPCLVVKGQSGSFMRSQYTASISFDLASGGISAGYVVITVIVIVIVVVTIIIFIVGVVIFVGIIVSVIVVIIVITI